jgi:hypothetical protein
LETYTEPKELVENRSFQEQRQKALAVLNDDQIDGPIVDLINDLNRMPFCYTVQCCYGHFVPDGSADSHTLEPLPETAATGKVEYRIAYICFCVENSAEGRGFLKILKGITDIDPDNIQFCSAEWVWEIQVNTYALQVEPDRFKDQDTAELGYEEALKVEKIRDEFFSRLRSSIAGGSPDRRAD